MYMNLETGEHGTKDTWWYEDENGDQVNAVDLGEVLLVEKNENGVWVEV